MSLPVWIRDLSANRLDAVRSYLDEHPDAVNERFPQVLNRTSLFFARTPEAVDLLVSYGAILSDRDGVKNTLLHLLTAYPETVRYLVGRGVDVDAQNSRGQTALIRAVADDNTETVQTLLELGADPTLTDVDGRNSLSYGIEQGASDSLIRLLIDEGVELVRDRNGNDPFSVLSQEEREGLSSYLLQARPSPEQIQAISEYVQICRNTYGGKEPLIAIARAIGLSEVSDRTTKLDLCRAIQKELRLHKKRAKEQTIACINDADLITEEVFDEIPPEKVYQYGPANVGGRRHCVSEGYLDGLIESGTLFIDPFSQKAFSRIASSLGGSVKSDYTKRKVGK